MTKKMYMDRRRNTRKKVPTNRVYVYYRGKRVHRCKASDISPAGVFIETRSLTIPLGAKVQLLFVLNQGNISKTYRKSAVITRVANHGAGLGFLTRRTKRTKAVYSDP